LPNQIFVQLLYLRRVKPLLVQELLLVDAVLLELDPIPTGHRKQLQEENQPIFSCPYRTE